MDEDEVIKKIIDHLENFFPKTCPNCGIVFNSFSEYLQKTTPVGDPVSYDLNEGEPKPHKPLGTHADANCQCGSTLILSSKGMNPFMIWRLTLWVRVESVKRRISSRELMRQLRVKVKEKTLCKCRNS